MADVELENVSLDNAVIFRGTKLADTDIERSIVDRDARIEGIPLDGALISAHTTLTDDPVSGD
jgi:hypothetical protein